MSATARLPPFEVIAAALRTTTERLAGEVVAPWDAPPEWTDFEWALARAASAIHGISAQLANRLRWRGPPAWQDFLAEQQVQSLARDQRIGALLSALDERARAADVAVVALKGSALRKLRLYAAGERPQGDIDLLVEESALARLAAVLEALGYYCAFTVRRHGVFAPRAQTRGPAFGEHDANPLRIEVHTRIAEALPATPVDITASLAPSPLEPGINPYRDEVALMLHLALHAAGSMRAHALRFVQLQDIARLAPHVVTRGWCEMARLPAMAGGSWWLAAPLELAERYHPGALPKGFLDELWRKSPRTLRRAILRRSLTDVSLSNLRIHALTGIEWARTPLEALRLAWTRVVPGRQALAELKDVVGAMPALEITPWYGLKHHHRILRWLFGKPMRPHTLATVSAALAPASRGNPDTRLR